MNYTKNVISAIRLKCNLSSNLCEIFANVTDNENVDCKAFGWKD